MNLSGNHVEGVPDWINRTGLTARAGPVKVLVKYSYVGKNFSDATNAVYVPTGIIGYCRCRYFTRRINMYPGPGILPADGRTFYVSLALKF